jgi:23S rRNA maturation-related 3'-5' exoribonuclease YhaM
MNTFNIDEVVDGQVVTIDAVLTNLAFIKAKNNSFFISGTASNKDVSIPIRVWNAEENQFETLKNTKFISLLGTISIYNGTKSLIINKTRKLENYNPNDFIPMYEITDEKKFFIRTIIDNIENENYKKLIDSLITKKYCKLGCSIFKYNKYNGNYEYIYDLLNMADSLLRNNSSELYANIDKEAIYTALILYNIGSIEAQKYDEFRMADDLTTIGKLLSVPVLSLKIIVETCKEQEIDTNGIDIVTLLSLITSNNNGKPANIKDVQFFRQIIYIVESFCKMETSISDIVETKEV